MSRYSRNMLLLAKVETTAGTEAAPSASTDAVLIVDSVDITPLEINYADRKLLLPYFGGSMQLLGSYNSKISFTTEASPSGTAGTTAAWGKLLLGCGAAEAVEASPARVETTPISTGLKTLTLYLYDDGVLHKLVGSMGSVKFSAKLGEVARWQFEFIGSYSPPSAATAPAATLTQWKVPPVLNKNNVVDITLGCTYTAGTLSGGAIVSSTGLELDFGNKTSFFATLSSERAELTDRDSKISYEVELSAADEVDAMANMVNNELESLGFTIGTAAGKTLMLFAPSIQRTGIKKADKEGVRLIGFEGKLVPLAGNDEWRFIQL